MKYDAGSRAAEKFVDVLYESLREMQDDNLHLEHATQ